MWGGEDYAHQITTGPRIFRPFYGPEMYRNITTLIFLALYFTDIPSDVAKRGITLELCAGIVDKEGKSLAEIASEEGRTSIRFYDFDYVLRYKNYAAKINVVCGCPS